MIKRHEELDSLRGVAAVIVLIHHYTAILPFVETRDTLLVKLIDYTPLRIIWSGPQAVIFFFILSGFVLSLLFTKETKERTDSFLVKRICRIYIPYLIAILIAIVMNYLFSKGGTDDLSDWFNGLWNTPITVNLIVNHILFLGNYDTTAFDIAIWSLIHELRISLIFPIIMWFILRFSWKSNIIIAAALSFTGLFLNELIYKPEQIFTGYTLTTSYLSSLHYCSIFIFGALLAKNKEPLIIRVKTLNKKAKLALFLFGIILYSYVYIPKIIFDAGDINQIMINYATAAGSSIFIILAFSSTTFSTILKKKPILSLGKYSYSLYLYHAIVLFTLVNLLFSVIWTPLLLVICAVISICIAAFSYHYIEIPSNRLGKKISIKFGKTENSKVHKAM